MECYYAVYAGKAESTNDARVYEDCAKAQYAALAQSQSRLEMSTLSWVLLGCFKSMQLQLHNQSHKAKQMQMTGTVVYGMEIRAPISDLLCRLRRSRRKRLVLYSSVVI